MVHVSTRQAHALPSPPRRRAATTTLSPAFVLKSQMFHTISEPAEAVGRRMSQTLSFTSYLYCICGKKFPLSSIDRSRATVQSHMFQLSDCILHITPFTGKSHHSLLSDSIIIMNRAVMHHRPFGGEGGGQHESLLVLPLHE